MSNRPKTKKGIVSAIFRCAECDISWQNYIDAQDKANRHTKQTGHKTQGEVCYAVTYEKNEVVK